jgi:hypothetical protein
MFVTLSTDILDVRDFTIYDTNPNGADMTAVRDYVDGVTTPTGSRRTAASWPTDSRARRSRSTPRRRYGSRLASVRRGAAHRGSLAGEARW